MGIDWIGWIGCIGWIGSHRYRNLATATPRSGFHGVQKLKHVFERLHRHPAAAPQAATPSGALPGPADLH